MPALLPVRRGRVSRSSGIFAVPVGVFAEAQAGTVFAFAGAAMIFLLPGQNDGETF
jgi:hypothetical protein